MDIDIDKLKVEKEGKLYRILTLDIHDGTVIYVGKDSIVQYEAITSRSNSTTKDIKVVYKV